MKFELVNHSYNYSRLLAYQLSSLILYNKGHDLTYSMYVEHRDIPTWDCIDYFKPLMPDNVKMQVYSMELGLLKNRAIGRNISAKTTNADWVWFTDTDYCFNDQTWDMLTSELKDSTAEFVWPKRIWETSWDTGDQLMAEMTSPMVGAVHMRHVVEKRMRRGIGGVQIARGDVVRETGYCPSYSGPCDDWNFRSDVHFRRQFSRMKEVDLWHVIRIRHRDKGYGAPNLEVNN